MSKNQKICQNGRTFCIENGHEHKAQRKKPQSEKKPCKIKKWTLFSQKDMQNHKKSNEFTLTRKNSSNPSKTLPHTTV